MAFSSEVVPVRVKKTRQNNVLIGAFTASCKPARLVCWPYSSRLPERRQLGKRCHPVLGKHGYPQQRGPLGRVLMIRTRWAGVASAFSLTGSASAQQAQPPAAPPPVDFSRVEIKTTGLGDNLYMLEGQGGNITVAVAKDGIIMVDGQFAPRHEKIKAAIASLSSLPLKYLVDTHFHGDHTGGNEAFAGDGATIVAHENVKKRLAAGTTNGLTGVKTPPAAPS